MNASWESLDSGVVHKPASRPPVQHHGGPSVDTTETPSVLGKITTRAELDAWLALAIADEMAREHITRNVTAWIISYPVAAIHRFILDAIAGTTNPNRIPAYAKSALINWDAEGRPAALPPPAKSSPTSAVPTLENPYADESPEQQAARRQYRAERKALDERRPSQDLAEQQAKNTEATERSKQYRAKKAAELLEQGLVDKGDYLAEFLPENKGKAIAGWERRHGYAYPYDLAANPDQILTKLKHEDDPKLHALNT